MASALLRHCLGVRIVFHIRGAQSIDELVDGQQDVIISSNHRTRLDWMFLWCLVAALGRLGGLKIVLKDGLRKIPGFGWATQCFGFAFMSRKDRSADLATLKVVTRCFGGCGSLALLIFPEGTDLSESNVERDRAFADKQGLDRYSQVLHPRTAGFITVWEAMNAVATANGAPAPALLDVTMAYVDYVAGERPNEQTVFLKGRVCREVHILLERVVCGAGAEEVEEKISALFAEKEARLSRFYKLKSTGSELSQPDVSALADGALTVSLEASRGASLRMASGTVAIMWVEFISAFLAWRCGTLRTISFAGMSFLAFALMTSMKGGVDQLLFSHVARFPGEAHAGKDE